MKSSNSGAWFIKLKIYAVYMLPVVRSDGRRCTGNLTALKEQISFENRTNKNQRNNKGKNQLTSRPMRFHGGFLPPPQK